MPQFAGISGESENSAGAALTALAPIQAIAALDIGVICVRHDRKASGDVGDSARGSSAWGGVCDTIISIRRGDAASKPTMRVLHTLSRFDGPPDKLVIDLQDGEYVALGTETRVVEQETRQALWAAMPESEEHAKTRDELIEAAEVKPTVAKTVIKTWYEAEHLGRVGAGKSGDPQRFWKLDIGRSEPPVLATNQYSEPEIPVASPETLPGSDDIEELKSRSVGTTTLRGDQPIIPDTPDSGGEVRI